MKLYYIFSSKVDATAEVESQSPEKAITKYLSYLVETGQLAHTERGALRPFVRWSHTEPNEFVTDVKLTAIGKGYLPENTSSLDTSNSVMSKLPAQQSYSQPAQEYLPEEEFEEGPAVIAPSVLPPSYVSAVPNEQDSVFGNSPIMTISKKRRAL